MNLNNLVFVPSMNSTTTAAAAAIGAANSAPNTNMMVPGAGHFMGKAPPAPPPHHHHHHHAHGGSPNASSAAMYHMRQMASYHQQQQRFYHPQSPPQRSGFSYYHQGPRHFYNNSMMNGRPPLPGLGPHPNANNAGGIWPSLKPGNNYAGISTKAPIASNKLSMDSKESPPPPPNEINKDTLVDTLNATSAGELNTSNNKNNNKPTSASANKAVAPHKKSEKFDKVLNKQLTKHPKIKRSDSKCSMKSTTTTLAVVATVAASTETSSSSSSITTTTNTACVKVVKKDIKQREQHKKKSKFRKIHSIWIKVKFCLLYIENFKFVLSVRQFFRKNYEQLLYTVIVYKSFNKLFEFLYTHTHRLTHPNYVFMLYLSLSNKSCSKLSAIHQFHKKTKQEQVESKEISFL
uniref:Uncharacterized protein n=1 Tax=Stomoxys calcitrans TaxID=35570 RepID=A0A1I8NXJ8_STOCA